MPWRKWNYICDTLMSKENLAKLHAFRSGGGLRVLYIKEINNKKNDSLGYGEAPQFSEAVQHLDEDLAAGGRPYKEVYGKIYPHYLTGTSEIEEGRLGGLDWWLLCGRSFDISYFSYQNNFLWTSEFIRQLNFREEMDLLPANKYSRKFYKDGITYEHYHTMNGTSIKVVVNHSGLDPWMRGVKIECRAKTFEGVLEEACKKIEWWKAELS